MAKRESINSIIGEGSYFKGTYMVKGSFQIDGKFEGDLKIDGHLIIGTNGKVKTSTIITDSITIAGTLIGNISASNEVILIETGRVLGNIEAPKIDVGEGAVIQGEMTITGGQKKNIIKIVEDSFSDKLDNGLNNSDNELNNKVDNYNNNNTEISNNENSNSEENSNNNYQEAK